MAHGKNIDQVPTISPLEPKEGENLIHSERERRILTEKIILRQVQGRQKVLQVDH